ncbi:uncharacterized protein LOC111411125 [Olea europaea var. sylvestris]|uniref:uncharacterized protein LOC111411125 n=1 Tax=Olea europaea var. sylvestris TaxID=158386 RepID=UPI000C1D340C|nr:uncharacterized protein LOC111411125 [Olea europaea var. sylvestris]
MVGVPTLSWFLLLMNPSFLEKFENFNSDSSIGFYCSLIKGLFGELMDILHNLEFDIDNVRGQVYDNGANLKGKHKEVQNRLLQLNLRALYSPCGCHNLYLALCDMTTCCSKAKYFFGVVLLLRELISAKFRRAIDVLDYIKRMNCWSANTWIIYRVLLTIPVTGASAGRIFSKLKLIKFYL